MSESGNVVDVKASDFGKKFEVIQPCWKTNAIVGGILLILALFLFFTVHSLVAKILFGLFALGAGSYFLHGLALYRSGITFYEKGIEVKEPFQSRRLIPIEKIDHYDWEAETETVVEEDLFSRDVDTTHRITLLLNYEDQNGGFQEVSWTEEYPAGSIARFQRATERAKSYFESLDYNQGSTDEFYDE